MANSSIDNPAPPVERLTRRESEILALLVGNLYVREIAASLTLAPASVKWYIHQIYAKLGVSSRQEAVQRARALGLLPVNIPEKVRLSNLPAGLTPFVGRQKDLQHICALLADPGYRLLTLTGAGGVGKTRLALQVARSVQQNYPHGAWLVELASLSEPDLLPNAVAAVFHLCPDRQMERTGLEMLVDVLRSKKLLLVLDNCEHLVSACAALAHNLLQFCPDLRILATSREALGIEAERTYLVPSLAFPPADADLSPEAMAHYEAVDLFTRRAAVACPDFILDDQNIGSVAGICRHLDGIPLALELAASRLCVMDLEQIAAQLQDRFQLLSGGNRVAPPRLQTMRASIDWSYQLLSEAEKTVLRRLSVFSGGWSLPAARSVCADESLPSAAILDLLQSLISKSLVGMVRKKGQEPRYGMLETIRQYVSEKLIEAGEASLMHTQHLTYFLDLAERAEPEMLGPDQITWFDRLDMELDNLRAALEWSLADGPDRAAIGLRIATAIWWFWSTRGHPEGEDWFEKTLDASEASADPLLRARALGRSSHLGFFNVNIKNIEAALVLGQSLGEAGRESVAEALICQASWAAYQDDRPRQVALATEALHRFREIGHRWGICDALGWLSNGLCALGDLQHAWQAAEECLVLAREAGDINMVAGALWNMGDSARVGKNFTLAKKLFLESLEIFRQMKYELGMSDLTGDLGKCALQAGNGLEALSYFRQSLDLAWQKGSLRQLAVAMERVAYAGVVVERPQYAARLLGAAEALRASEEMALYPIERARYDEYSNLARSQLDGSTFSACWAEGRAMSVRQAVEYALNEIRSSR